MPEKGTLLRSAVNFMMVSRYSHSVVYSFEEFLSRYPDADEDSTLDADIYFQEHPESPLQVIAMKS